MGYFDFPRCPQCGGKLHEFGRDLRCGDCGVSAGKKEEIEALHRARDAERKQAEAARLQGRSQQLASDLAVLGRIAEAQAPAGEAAVRPPGSPVELPPALAALPASRPVLERPQRVDLGPADQMPSQLLEADPAAAPAPAAPRGKRGK